MSAQAQFKCPTCDKVKHINMANVTDKAPRCPDDGAYMVLLEVSS